MNYIDVLIVDDQENFRRILERAVTRAGYSAITASSLPQALHILNTISIAILITDLRLSRPHDPDDEGGMVLLEWVTHNRPTTQKICITGYATSRAAGRAWQDFGVLGFLSKATYNHEELTELIREAIENQC